MGKTYIFTLNWNGCDKMRNLYNSLIPSLKNIDYEWIIKDNGSKDNSVETIKSWEGNIKVIPYKDNQQNFAAGMNYLFANASPADNDNILLLNNDVVFNDTTSISNMLSILSKDTTVGAVGARLTFPGTQALQHAGVIFDKQYGTPMHFRLNETSDEHAQKNRLFQVVTGAVLLTKAEYYKNAYTNKSGARGMDEGFHWAFDDVDLCLSIYYNLKKKIVYCGNTNISHEQSATLKKNPANKLFINHNLQYLFDKWKKRYAIDGDIYRNDNRHNLYRG